MPNVMAALPNIGGALSSMPQNMADAHYYCRVPYSNAAKTRNPFKLAGVPQTPEPISAVSTQNSTILRGHMEQILLLNTFFRLSVYALVAKIQPNKVVRWCQDGYVFALFLRPVFPASRVQHISDLHPKFARPHHV